MIDLFFLFQRRLSTLNTEVFPCCVGAIGSLTEDIVIRSHFANSLIFWDSCLMTVVSDFVYVDIQYMYTKYILDSAGSYDNVLVSCTLDVILGGSGVFFSCL